MSSSTPAASTATLTLTLHSPTTGQTDAISLGGDTPFSTLLLLAPSLLNLPDNSTYKLIPNFALPQIAPGTDPTLSSLGFNHGDIIQVVSQTAPSASASSSPSSSGMGGLDFTSLLSPSSSHPPAPPSNSMASSSSSSSSQPVSFPTMNLNELINSNPNPQTFIDLLFAPVHSRCLKELNYHSPQLAQSLINSVSAANGDTKSARTLWTNHLVKSSISSVFNNQQSSSKENEMERKLRVDPLDAEANAYFGEKIRLKNVSEQFEEMMENYPESLGRVLMLYIPTKINGFNCPAFVDSGAQMTVMSKAFAEKCNILHLVDTNFAGYAVGVGKAKILGKVHIAKMEINDRYFQISVTVMDDNVDAGGEGGLGDKNMDFLLGLDMLKRHRCLIDMGQRNLVFRSGSGSGDIEVPFLNEYELPVSKGGTQGFSVEQEEMDRVLEQSKYDEEQRELKKTKTEEKK